MTTGAEPAWSSERLAEQLLNVDGAAERDVGPFADAPLVELLAAPGDLSDLVSRVRHLLLRILRTAGFTSLVHEGVVYITNHVTKVEVSNSHLNPTVDTLRKEPE